VHVQAAVGRQLGAAAAVADRVSTSQLCLRLMLQPQSPTSSHSPRSAAQQEGADARGQCVS
jgi:hypothetical protein